MYSNLEEIVIYDARMAKKEMVKFYIETLPQLKRLELNCENDFDGSCIDKLLKKENTEKLEFLSYGCNYYRNMAYLDERRHFPEDNRKERTAPLSNFQTEQLTSLPKLENIWIDYPSIDIINKIKQMKNLKTFALGRMDIDSQIIKIERRVWEVLSKLTGLTSITFNRIQIEADLYEQMLVRNKATLETICIYDCRKLRDHTMTVMRENLTLRELMLYRSGQVDFRGQDIWQMASLETLILRQCSYFDIQKAVMKAKQLTNLRHLSLMGCLWLTDDIVKQFCNNKHLVHLNIGNTNIAAPSTDHIKNLYQLRALHLGSTKCKGVYIADMSKSVKYLNKLNLKGLGLNDNVAGKGTINSKQLHLLGTNLPNLTHLDIGSCMNVDDTIFDSFHNIKFVNVWMANGISRAKRVELTKKGVVVIDESYNCK